jgi:hypothetical protein
MPSIQPMQYMPNIQQPQQYGYNNIMNPYPQQYPQYNPYGMYTPPINYNPQQMMNQQPLNNYNRGFNAPVYNPSAMTGNMYGMQTPNIVPYNKDNKNNQPIKLVGNNNSNIYSTNVNTNNLNEMISNSTRETVKENKLMSRRESDKAKRSSSIQHGKNSNISNINHNDKNSYIDKQDSSYLSNNGPATNPDSFSRRRGHSSNRPRSNADGSYRPYTLTEYKELASNKIVLGKLGPNIGTKEWEEKHEKVKKLQEYSGKIAKQHREILGKVKETPLERIEREKREKNEQTSVHKAKQYAKLIKPRSRGDYEHSTLDETKETKETKQDIEFKNIMHFHKNNNNNSNRVPSAKNRRYDDSLMSNDNSGRENDMSELEKLQKQRENYNIRINQIKESFLK